jgi:hypothetical protein
VRLVGASVTHERTLETREPSCMTRATKTFFIPMVHSPLGVAEPEAKGHVVTSESTSVGR